MLRNLILVFAISISFLCLGCPDDNGGSNNVERDFYIEDYHIQAMWRPCFGLDQPHAEGTDELTQPEFEDYNYILIPGRSYMLTIDYFNDQSNTRWIAFDVYVDGERFSSSGAIATVGKKIVKIVEPEGSTSIVLFNYVPLNLEGRDIYVEVWLEDKNGVASEIFIFDIEVHQLYYISE